MTKYSYCYDPHSAIGYLEIVLQEEKEAVIVAVQKHLSRIDSSGNKVPISEELIEHNLRVALSVPKLSQSKNKPISKPERVLKTKGFVEVFHETHKVFLLLTQEERVALLTTTIVCLIELRDGVRNIIDDNASIQGVTDLLRDRINTISTLLSLPDKCKQVGESIPVKLEKTVGKLEFHNPESTFFPEHVQQLYGLITYLRVFTPIWSDFLYRTNVKDRILPGFTKSFMKTNIVDTRSVEYIMLSLFIEQIQEHWYPIYEKTMKYIDKEIQKSDFDNEDNITALMTMGGLSEKMDHIILAKILFRKFQTVNLRSPGKKTLIGLMFSAISNHRKTLLSSKNRYGIRRSDSGDDDPNFSSKNSLEVDSAISVQTLDVVVFTLYLFEELVDWYCDSNNIDPKIFKEIVTYNDLHCHEIHNFEVLLLSNVYGKHFGGAESIKLLNRVQLITLLTILQHYCFKNNRTMLGLALCAQRRSLGFGEYEPQDQMDDDIGYFKRTYHNDQKYQELKGLLEYSSKMFYDPATGSVGAKRRFRTLHDMLETVFFNNLTNVYSSYNNYLWVSPHFVEWFKLGEPTGLLYKPTSLLITEFCTTMMESLTNQIPGQYIDPYQ